MDVLWFMDWLGFHGFLVISLLVIAHILVLRRGPGAGMGMGGMGAVDVCGFVLGMLLSVTMNRAMKAWVRDPRPTGAVPFDFGWGWGTDADWYRGSEQFGFPSGHAQSAFYALAFFFGVLRYRVTPVFLVAVFVAALSVYQRWKYRRHTVEQLAAGSVLGTLLGFGVFFATRAVWGRVREGGGGGVGGYLRRGVE